VNPLVIFIIVLVSVFLVVAILSAWVNVMAVRRRDNLIIEKRKSGEIPSSDIILGGQFGRGNRTSAIFFGAVGMLISNINASRTGRNFIMALGNESAAIYTIGRPKVSRKIVISSSNLEAIDMRRVMAGLQVRFKLKENSRHTDMLVVPVFRGQDMEKVMKKLFSIQKKSFNDQEIEFVE